MHGSSSSRLTKTPTRSDAHRPAARRQGMEIVTGRTSYDGHSHGQGRQRKASAEHVVAQLLDSPLPTPRRSCCGSAADTPRSLRLGSAAGASPQRTHVPFSWESSPGVPKDACGGDRRREMLPPKPPPGRGSGGGGARAYHGNTTDATSSDDDDEAEEDTFSDALDRTSSSDRLAAFSVRLSSIDAGSRRSPSFIMDRFLPAANAIATTSADKHPKKSPRCRDRCSKHDEAPPPPPPREARRETNFLRRAAAGEQTKHFARRQSKEAAPAKITSSDEHRDQEESPRACGSMFFFPWNVKPALCGFTRSPARRRTPRAAATASPPHRSTTLGDVLAKESINKPCNAVAGDLSGWHEEKSSGSGKEWSSPGWGMAILGTSKRYCADARKALSWLARSATDGGGGDSPTVSKETRSGKPAASASAQCATSGKMPQLKPPSESWLSHARGRNPVYNRR